MIYLCPRHYNVVLDLNFITLNGINLMAFEIEGKLYRIFDEQAVSEKFKKREFVLEVESGQYPQLIKFQVVQDRVSLLDQYQTGQQVKVHFDITGKEFVKGSETLYFTNLAAWKIESADGAKSAAKSSAPRKDSAPVSMDPPLPSTDMDDLPF